MSPDELIKLIKNIVDGFFPEKQFKGVFVEDDSKNTNKFYVGKIPIRILTTLQGLAFACEESNRGDARGSRIARLKPRYANIFMPLGLYILLRKGATTAEAKMAMK